MWCGGGLGGGGGGGWGGGGGGGGGGNACTFTLALFSMSWLLFVLVSPINENGLTLNHINDGDLID